jgi:hypothetical protein
MSVIKENSKELPPLVFGVESSWSLQSLQSVLLVDQQFLDGCVLNEFM